MHNIIRFFMGVILSLFTAGAIAKPVQKFVLDNGLKVFVKEDHRSPVAIFQIWYKVGSADEPSGITGISHALEHMMFKGTSRYPNGAFTKIIDENGGQQNASTSRDWTMYYQLMSVDHLEDSFKLEADRMSNLKMEEEAFTKEMKVVKEERRLRTDNKPRAKLSERFNGVAFLGNPYAHPVIGWMHELDQMTVSDLKKWYKTWYTPNNATIVVVGDVSPVKVQQFAKRYFGIIPKRQIPAMKQRKLLPPLGERRLTAKLPAKLPWIMMAYNTPARHGFKHEWEPYALDVLAAILDGGNSARFNKELVREKQIASGANAGFDSVSRFASLFSITATPSKGNTVAALEQALREQIQAMKTTSVSDRELQRVKNQVIASKTYDQDSITTQAFYIGLTDNVGLPWQFIDEYPDKIQAVTAKQVMQVANDYLLDDHLTVGILEPTTMSTAPAQEKE